jgi:ribosomal protein S18 acetylase RimI-like enzyme
VTRAKVVIRAYRHDDLPVVRRICADTGFLGRPIDPVFEDRELFADYLTGYYTRVEPDALLVCEVAGTVKGYVMGCRRPLVNQAYQALANLAVAGKASYRCFARPYNRPSRAFMKWVLFNGWREIPAAPRLTPHFHINLLPDARGVTSTRMLIEAFLTFLHQHGQRRVYGQMVTYSTRRGESLFKRYGFQVLDRVEITKFRRLYADRVFLSTVMKDLSAGPAIDRQTPPAGAQRQRAHPP